MPTMNCTTRKKTLFTLQKQTLFKNKRVSQSIREDEHQWADSSSSLFIVPWQIQNTSVPEPT